MTPAPETTPPAASVTGHPELDKALEAIYNIRHTYSMQTHTGEVIMAYAVARAAKAAPPEPKAEAEPAPTTSYNVRVLNANFAELKSDIQALRTDVQQERADRQRLASAHNKYCDDTNDILRKFNARIASILSRLEGIGEDVSGELAKTLTENLRPIGEMLEGFNERFEALEESRPAPAASGPGLDEEMARRIVSVFQAWSVHSGDDDANESIEGIGLMADHKNHAFDSIAVRYILRGVIEPAAPEGEGKK